MAKTAPLLRPAAPPAGRFRTEIETALSEGLELDDLLLRLTLRDAHLLARDPEVPLADISYAGCDPQTVRMKTRGDQFRSRADAAEASATTAASPELERQFLAVAAQWRDLARQADEHDTAVRQARLDSQSQRSQAALFTAKRP